MWIGEVIIWQVVGALVAAFVFNLVWKAMNPGKGWFG